MIQTLNGLAHEYDPFIAAVTNQAQFISFSELRAKLLIQEQRLKRHSHSSSVELQLAFTVTSTTNHGKGRGYNIRGKPGYFNGNRGNVFQLHRGGRFTYH